MKRVLLSFLFCCFGFIALSQSTTVRIFAKSTITGDSITGSATFNGLSYTRTFDNIVSGVPSSGTTSRGYAVFDLDSLPPGAVVSSVVTQFYVSTYAAGGAGTWTTYGYPGDLSTVTNPAVLYTNMVAGTSLSSSTYGTASGLQSLPTSTNAETFVQSNVGSKVSWCWTSTSSTTRTYYITGETGLASAAAGHAPYIDVTYTCPGVSGVAATASPNPVCPGNTFTLTATGSAGLTYSWKGPGTYTAAGATATRVAGPTTPGIYTLTATTASGCRVIVTTPNVTNSTTVPTITAPSGPNVCVGGTASLTASPTGGNWTSGTASLATVNVSSGLVTGVAQGTAIITYTNAGAPFCWAVQTMNVNAVPGPIMPALPRVCVGSTITLSDTANGGTWSVTPAGILTISSTGVVNGGTPGTATVSYNNTCGTPATVVVTVDPLPVAITGPTSVCEWGGIITLSSPTTGGTWSSSNTNATATAISPTQGKIVGVNDGTATITYTSPAPQSCNTTYAITINPAPNPITGVLKHCVGTPTTLSNSIPGGTWASGTPPVATMLSPGVFFGASGGFATISYTNACGTITALDTVVATPPPFIGGDTVCEGGTLVLADAVLGGTWSSSAPAFADVLPGSGVVSGIAVGTATITYTLPPGCAVTGMVRVIAGPPAITGGTQVCPGKTTALANASAGGTWSSASPAVATVGVTSGVVTGITANTALISYTDIHGCVATTTVIVNPIPPTIIGDSLLCPGVVDTLYNPAIGGTWSSLTTGLASIGSATGIMNTLNGGNAVIRYTFTGTGCYIDKIVTIHAAPAPIVTYNFFTNTFEATTGFSGYQWYNNVEGLIPGATHTTTAAIVNGDYYVTVLDSNGCIGMSAAVPYNSAMLNVNNSTLANSCRIYPNPARDMVYIDATAKVNVVVTDAAGRKELEAKGVNKLDISKLAPGLYIITVQDDKGIKLAQQKLVKE